MYAQIQKHTLSFERHVVLTEVGGAFSTAEAGKAGEEGCFLSLSIPENLSQRHRAILGKVADAERFAALSLRGLAGLRVLSGGAEALASLPLCLWLLVQRRDGRYALIVPLATENEVSCLRGSVGGTLSLVLENGAPQSRIGGGVCVYVGLGDDYRRLLRSALRSVERVFGETKLRTKKDLHPLEAELTYSDVGEAENAEFLKGFKQLQRDGISPGAMLLEKNWLRTEPSPQGGLRISAEEPLRAFKLGAEEKRALGLRYVAAAMGVFGASAGLSPENFPKSRPRAVGAPASLLFSAQELDALTAAHMFYLPTPAGLRVFYKGIDSALKKRGVDGLLLDEAWQLGVTAPYYEGRGEALDVVMKAANSLKKQGAAFPVLSGSTAPDLFYRSRYTELVRVSGKGQTEKAAESPGDELRAKSLFGAWFGAYQALDWGCFDASAVMADYAAAARAVCGSAMSFFVRDGESARAEVLKRCAYSDGRAVRFAQAGSPTVESLFLTDAAVSVKQAKLAGVPPKGFVVVNRVCEDDGSPVAGPHCVGSAGVFDLDTRNAVFPGGGAQAFVSPADVPGLTAKRYAAWHFHARELSLLDRHDTLSVRTGDARFELITFAPIKHSTYAIFGLVSHYATAATLQGVEEYEGGLKIMLGGGGGEFAAALTECPASLRLAGKSISFTYAEESGLLLANIPSAKGTLVLDLRWTSA